MFADMSRRSKDLDGSRARLGESKSRLRVTGKNLIS